MTGQEAWVSLAEAARLTGKSEKTLKRWAAKGKLTIDRSLGRPRIQVEDLKRLDILDRVGVDTSGQNRREDPDTTGQRLSELQEELRRARDDAERWQGEALAWRHQAERLVETLGQLSLPPAREEVIEAEPAPRKRGLWAWFLGRKEGS